MWHILQKALAVVLANWSILSWGTLLFRMINSELIEIKLALCSTKQPCLRNIPCFWMNESNPLVFIAVKSWYLILGRSHSSWSSWLNADQTQDLFTYFILHRPTVMGGLGTVPAKHFIFPSLIFFFYKQKLSFILITPKISQTPEKKTFYPLEDIFLPIYYLRWLQAWYPSFKNMYICLYQNSCEWICTNNHILKDWES